MTPYVTRDSIVSFFYIIPVTSDYAVVILDFVVEF